MKQRPAYYNEHNERAADWLQWLIDCELITPGIVDRRSITAVTANDLSGFAQCHFFAGIGGWDQALYLAGWPPKQSVWTGSCPCQPFSSAGKGRGLTDERHLWPTWKKLIAKCRPSTVYGEQVATAISHGWWDHVATDFEASNYACAASVLRAFDVQAPHQRRRLYFVAHAIGERLSWATKRPQPSRLHVIGGGHTARNVANTTGMRLQGQRGQWQTRIAQRSYVSCTDGKHRLVEPSIHLLANGVPARMAKLQGLGNAIVPQLGAAFIMATSPCVGDVYA